LSQKQAPVLPEATAGATGENVSAARVPGAVVVDAGAVGDVGAGVDAGANAAAATQHRKTAKETAGSEPNTTGCHWRRARDRSWRVGTASAAAAAVNGRMTAYGRLVKAVRAAGDFGYCGAAESAEDGRGHAKERVMAARSQSGGRLQTEGTGILRTVASGGSGKYEARGGRA